MLNDMINHIFPLLIFSIIAAILGFIASIVSMWWDAHKGLIEMQRQQIAQTMEINKYAQNITIAKLFIHSVEEQSRNFNWDSTLKHATATELISNVTGFSSDEIFNIIKATVDELKANELKVQSTQSVEAPKILDSTDEITNEKK
ncbi:MAG: hypothetical protein H7Y18_02285 [Clostridiaceae bacterium]|nr:hypothetical protein [Clostridiaceae bacterium]